MAALRGRFRRGILRTITNAAKENDPMPTIYIIGDSTVEDNTPPFRGWGWALPQYTAPLSLIHI